MVSGFNHYKLNIPDELDEMVIDPVPDFLLNPNGKPLILEANFSNEMALTAIFNFCAYDSLVFYSAIVDLPSDVSLNMRIVSFDGECRLLIGR